MPSSTDLINAIRQGNAVEIENTFNVLMADRISTNIDAFRNTVMVDTFNREVDDGQEAS